MSAKVPLVHPPGILLTLSCINVCQGHIKYISSDPEMGFHDTYNHGKDGIIGRGSSVPVTDRPDVH